MGDHVTKTTERDRQGMALIARGFVVLAMVASVLLVGSPATAEAQGTGSISTPDTEGRLAPAVALDASGNPVIAYFAGADFEIELRILTCGNPSCTSGNTINTLDANLDVIDGDIFMRLNAAGHPVVAYSMFNFGTGSGGQTKLFVATCGDPTCSSGNVIADDSAIGFPGNEIVSFDFDAAGNAVLALTANEFDPLPRLVRCGNPTCTDSNTDITPSVVDAGMKPGTLQIDATGALILPIAGSRDQGDLLLHCSDTSCANATLSTLVPGEAPTVSSPRPEAYQPAMVLDPSGNPVISYQEDRGAGMKVVRCADPQCSSEPSIVTVDVDGFTSNRAVTSIGLIGERPVVAYQHQPTGEIRVAFCGNAACSGGNRIVTVGPGATPDLAVGAGGSVMVVYAGVNGVEVWHCAGAPCGGVGTCAGELATIDLSLPAPPAPTSGRDVIVGTSGPDVINALGGDDLICALGGDDTITGGDGADLIIAGGGDDEVTGDAGDDRLLGGQGNDTMAGGDGADTLHGNRGDDDLDGGSGDDRIFGYADNDTIRGGDGNDRLHGNFGEDVIFGDAGNDIVIGYGDDDILHGGDGDDRMHGNFGDDMMFGDAGDDRMWGYGDDDTMSGGPGQDLLTGNRGDDLIEGGDDDDTLFGSDGADDLNGGPGNDSVTGNSGDDIVSGGDGDDTLDGGINADICNGDAGTDSATRCETENDIP